MGELCDVTKLAGFEFTKYVIYSDEGTIIALRGLNVKNGEIVLDDVKYIDQSDFSKLNRSKLFRDDILLTYVGTVGELAIIPENNKYYLAPNVARIRLKKGINSQFIMQMMGNKTYYDKVIFPLIATSSQPALSMENVRKFILKLPEFEEQTKTGAFFKKIDTLIAANQRKLDRLRMLKKGYLQQIFEQKMRFNGYSEPWEQHKLFELAIFLKGKGYSKSDLTESGDKIILYGRMYTKYETVINDVDTFVVGSNDDVLSEQGDVIVPGSGETAKDISRASVVGKSGIIIGGDLNVIKPNDEVDSVFLALAISNGQQHKELTKQAQGKSIVHLHNEDLKQVMLNHPSLEEQAQIGTFFNKIDDLITANQTKLAHLKRLKKSYLQQMFI